LPANTGQTGFATEQQHYEQQLIKECFADVVNPAQSPINETFSANKIVRQYRMTGIRIKMRGSHEPDRDIWHEAQI